MSANELHPNDVFRKAVPQIAGAVSQITLLIGVFIGVLLSQSILAYKSGTFTEIPKLDFNVLVIRAGIALVITPIVYERTVKSDSPFVVRFCLYVQNGAFWPLILDALSKKP